MIDTEKSADCPVSCRTFPFNVDKRKPIPIILTITFDLPSLFSFVGPTSNPRHDDTLVVPHPTSNNSAQERDDAEMYAKFDVQNCKAQKQGRRSDPKPLIRRALSESDLTRTRIQLLNVNNDDILADGDLTRTRIRLLLSVENYDIFADEVPDRTPAERAEWFRTLYYESLKYLAARIEPFDANLDLEKEARERRAECTRLRTRFDSLRKEHLRQKYQPAGRFTAQRWIWLFVRTRRLPEDTNPTETTSGPSLTEFQVSCLERKIRLTCRNLQESTTSDHFEIDHYIAPSSTNQDVYREIAPLIDIVFGGYDVCIFADGQSGSGKSWTMFKGEDAIALSIAASVTTWKTVGAALGWTRQVKYSAIESYRDRLNDLLVEEKGEAIVDIPKAKTGRYDRSAATLEELLDLFQRAYTNREVGKTHENRESSRGHFFSSLVLAQSNPDGPPVRSRITLIDLAGGERIPTETKKTSPTTGKGGSSNAAADKADSFLAAETKFINSSRGALRTFLQQTRKMKQGSAVCEVGATAGLYISADRYSSRAISSLFWRTTRE